MKKRSKRFLAAVLAVFMVFSVMSVHALGSVTNERFAGQSETVREISAGGRHVVAIGTDGSLWAWGHASLLGLGSLHEVVDSNINPLGNGVVAIPRIAIPVRIGTANDWQSVSAGLEHTMGIVRHVL